MRGRGGGSEKLGREAGQRSGVRGLVGRGKGEEGIVMDGGGSLLKLAAIVRRAGERAKKSGTGAWGLVWRSEVEEGTMVVAAH